MKSDGTKELKTLTYDATSELKEALKNSDFTAVKKLAEIYNIKKFFTKTNETLLSFSIPDNIDNIFYKRSKAVLEKHFSSTSSLIRNALDKIFEQKVSFNTSLGKIKGDFYSLLKNSNEFIVKK